VDDGSRDRTPEILQSAAAELPRLVVVRHARNRGEGAAQKTGILHATGTTIVTIDGDGTYPSQEIPRLAALIPQFDMAVGARVREAGTVRWLRAPAKWAIMRLASFIVEQPIPDLNSGLRAFKRSAALKFFGILPEGHSWSSTITLAFLSNGYAVAYTPIDYFTRKGRSSFHPVRDTLNYIKLINRTIMYFRPLRFFAPLTVTLLAIGLVRFLYHAIVFQDVRESDTTLVLTAILVGAVSVTADLVLKLNRVHFIKMEPGGAVEHSGSTILTKP
jgi:glycosyltransferase involved in cell wall biosynthesis